MNRGERKESAHNTTDEQSMITDSRFAFFAELQSLPKLQYPINWQLNADQWQKTTTHHPFQRNPEGQEFL